MNKKELVKIIQEVVRLEIKKLGPELVRSALLESLQAPSEKQPTKIHRPAISNLVIQEESASPKRQVAEKQLIQFSTNPILNQVLNETRGGIPQEQTDQGVSVKDLIENTPKEVLSENAAIQSVATALNRDYRQLLKVAEEKAKKNRP